MANENQSEITRAMVNKYDCQGPRYTSYPTAPIWREDYTTNDYEAALVQGAKLPSHPLSIYLHIPFCRKLCWFCGCNKVISSNQDKASGYLDYVEKEIVHVASLLGKRTKVTQLHWGGGTPSLLNLDNTKRAFALINAHFDLQEDAEIAIEIDPRTADTAKIDLLRSLGFNRLSFGVQDLNASVQDAIGREQLESTTIELFSYSRQLGFSGINLDLIYGLPKQTPKSFIETIDKIIALRPDRVAMYSFAHIPKVIPGQRLMAADDMPTSHDKLTMFLNAQNQFLAAGYLQIGMDHFVLPQDELGNAVVNHTLRRNFMGYTVKSANDWVGFGMSAISFINGQFIQNHRKNDDYFKSIDASTMGVHRGMVLSKDDLIRQKVISMLMCHFEINIEAIEKEFDIVFDQYFKNEFTRLQPLVKDNLVTVSSKTISAIGIGKTLIRNIAMVFDIYLNANQTTQYSKTI